MLTRCELIVITSLWFFLIAGINQTEASQPIPGEVVSTYIVPDVFTSLNGLAWDGKYLWGVNYDKGRRSGIHGYLPGFLRRFFNSDILLAEEGKAYKMSFNQGVNKNELHILISLSLNMAKMEGVAHDGINTLYVGPRLSGSRTSAQVVGIDTKTTSTVRTYTDYLWPDLLTHGNYKDPDGIAHDGTNIYWVVNADHTADVSKAGVQVIGPTGKIIKRFWLPDEKPNDVTYAGGYLIYKPASANVIKLIDVNIVQDGGSAIAAEEISITGAIITDHWGTAHDGNSYLYIAQDKPGSMLWKLYLPLPYNKN